MPSGKMERGTCFSMVGVWFGKVAVNPGAMFERGSRMEEKTKAGGMDGKRDGKKNEDIEL